MLIAHYVGPAHPGLVARIGWELTVLGQKGPYDNCTHTEAIHRVHADGTCDIASSSLVDKGVRIKKHVRLKPEKWVITDVPVFEVAKSIDWFDEAIARGMQYDKRGALSTLLPGKQSADKGFCTEVVFAPFIRESHYLNPAIGLAICMGLGRVVVL
jgi:hypothetical protein